MINLRPNITIIALRVIIAFFRISRNNKFIIIFNRIIKNMNYSIPEAALSL